MGCQTSIVEQILKGEADYLIAVKGNQGQLERDIEDTIRFCRATSHDRGVDAGHGRVETRFCSVYTDLSHIQGSERWGKLSAVVCIEATRYFKATGREQTEKRYYITSSKGNADYINRAVRDHWGIENSLHWVLDVAFDEDASRKREGNAAQNFSLLLRIALNLIKKEKETKRSLKGKRLDAGWNNDYLLKILKN